MSTCLWVILTQYLTGSWVQQVLLLLKEAGSDYSQMLWQRSPLILTLFLAIFCFVLFCFFSLTTCFLLLLHKLQPGSGVQVLWVSPVSFVGVSYTHVNPNNVRRLRGDGHSSEKNAPVAKEDELNTEGTMDWPVFSVCISKLD